MDVSSASASAGLAPPGTNRRAMAIGLALAVLMLLLGGAYLYFPMKSASPVLSPTPAPSGASGTRSALSNEQLERMIAQALSQTQQEPKNASAWAMLAHAYAMLGRFAESAKAYATLGQLLPRDAQVLADQADVLAVVNGRSFKGEPIALLQRAVAIDPANAKALVLIGSAHFETQDYAQAVSYLERALAAATDPAQRREIDASLAQARAARTGASAPLALSPRAQASGHAVGASATAQVAGRVWLADGLRAKAPAQATLFLYARPVDGSRMPVAFLRKKVSELPLNFTLDDSMGMVPNVNLSKFASVVVVARVSARGDVTPAAGDLQGESPPVTVGSRNVQLEITEVLK